MKIGWTRQLVAAVLIIVGVTGCTSSVTHFPGQRAIKHKSICSRYLAPLLSNKEVSNVNDPDVKKVAGPEGSRTYALFLFAKLAGTEADADRFQARALAAGFREAGGFMMGTGVNSKDVYLTRAFIVWIDGMNQEQVQGVYERACMLEADGVFLMNVRYDNPSTNGIRLI